MTHIQDIYDALRRAAHHAGELEAERVQWEARALACEGGIVLPPDPPIIVDPPTPAPGAPDYSEFGFAHLMPAFPAYTRPTEADCDWVLDRANLVARSMRGLADLTWDATAPGIAGDCYRASRNAGHGPRVTIGVQGYGGSADVGGFYSGNAPHDVARGTEPIDVQFVGLTGNDEIVMRWGGPTWEQDYGKTERCAAFGIGLVGQLSNHAFTQTRPHWSTLILDDFWILAPEGVTAGWHAGLHVANWHTLVLRGLKRRGRTASEQLPKYSGHAGYLKHSSKPGSTTWVVGCDLRGANQTGVQRRPGKDEAYLGESADVMVYSDNICDGYGWDHTAEGGGSAISHWSGKQAFIVRNRALDVRYGGLLVSGQPLYDGNDRNWYDADGYPIGEVYIDGNKMSNPRSSRHCFSISNAAHAYIGDQNEIGGKLVLESQWIHTAQPPLPRSRVKLVGQLTKFPTPWTFDPAIGAERKMTAAEVQAISAATWEEALA